MTGTVYAVVGSKGGVGKTTTSLNLGAALGAAGYATVVVELDLAMANVVDFLTLDIDVRQATTIHDVLAGEAPVDGACYRVTDEFAVAISGTDLRRYADTDLSELPSAIEQLQRYYDIVLLDTPAGVSEESVGPLTVSDEALLVSTPRVASVRNAENTLELAWRTDTSVGGLVLTKSGTGASPGADRIADFLGLELLGHVPEDDAVPHSQDAGRPVVEYAPNSAAADAYRTIARRLVETEPANDRTRSGSFGSDRGSETGSGDGLETPGTERPGTVGPATAATPDTATDGGREEPDEGAESDAASRTDTERTNPSLGERIRSLVGL